MKTLTIMLAISLAFLSCKKSEDSKPSTSNPVITPTDTTKLYLNGGFYTVDKYDTFNRPPYAPLIDTMHCEFNFNGANRYKNGGATKNKKGFSIVYSFEFNFAYMDNHSVLIYQYTGQATPTKIIDTLYFTVDSIPSSTIVPGLNPLITFNSYVTFEKPKHINIPNINFDAKYYGTFSYIKP